MTIRDISEKVYDMFTYQINEHKEPIENWVREYYFDRYDTDSMLADIWVEQVAAEIKQIMLGY